MYVKVTHYDDTKTSIFEVDGEIITGHHFATDEKPDAQAVLGFDHWDFSASWLASDGPTGRYEDGTGKIGGDCWEYRYAWWRNGEGLVHAVITSGRIYLLGDNGKTIDRV